MCHTSNVDTCKGCECVCVCVRVNPLGSLEDLGSQLMCSFKSYINARSLPIANKMYEYQKTSEKNFHAFCCCAGDEPQKLFANLIDELISGN